MIMLHTVLSKDFDLLVDAAQWCGERIRIGTRVWRVLYRSRYLLVAVER